MPGIDLSSVEWSDAQKAEDRRVPASTREKDSPGPRLRGCFAAFFLCSVTVRMAAAAFLLLLTTASQVQDKSAKL